MKNLLLKVQFNLFGGLVDNGRYMPYTRKGALRNDRAYITGAHQIASTRTVIVCSVIFLSIIVLALVFGQVGNLSCIGY